MPTDSLRDLSHQVRGDRMAEGLDDVVRMNVATNGGDEGFKDLQRAYDRHQGVAPLDDFDRLQADHGAAR